MRVDLRDPGAPGISALFAGAGTAATLGIAELARAAIALDTSPSDLQRALLLVCGVYASIGAVGGIACWAARRVWAAPAAALGLIVAIAAGGTETRPILRVAAVALGLLVLRLGVVVLRRFDSLPTARIASSAALVAFGATCALAARAIPAYGPRWALGAAVAAAGGALLIWTPRVRGSAALLGAAALALAWQGAEQVVRLAPETRPAPSAPSVLLVTIDTLRADRVGAYGYAPAHTPTLDALAEEGVLFRNASAHSRFTGPSHISLLTGRLPTTTGSVVNMQPLASGIDTLAEALAGSGYITAAFPSAFTTQQNASGLPGRFQHSDGETREYSFFPFAVFRCVAVRAIRPLLEGPATWPYYRPAAATTDRAVRFLEANAGAPSFTWVHYFDPHVPYVPPVELRRADAELVSGEWYGLSATEQREIARDPARMDAMRGLYDAEIGYVDRELARLVEAARQSAPAGGVLIVVTADHGEPMGEHGNHWVRDLHGETLHVPLIFVPPAPAAVQAKVDADVRLIDLAPTLLDWLGLPPLDGADGESLVPDMRAEAGAPRVSLGILEPAVDEVAGRGVSVRLDGWKLIAQESWVDPRQSEVDLFDVAADPGETVDLSESRRDLVEKLGQLVPTGWPSGEVRPLSPEEREQLRALGYVE